MLRQNEKKLFYLCRYFLIEKLEYE